MKKKRAAYANLRRSIDKARGPEEEVERRIILAETLRENDEKEEAKEEYEIACAMCEDGWKDKILCVRAIAELLSEMGNPECNKFLKQYEGLVKGNPTQEQLYNTVAAWCHLRMFTYNEDKQYLNQALEELNASSAILKTSPLDSKYLDRHKDTKEIRDLNVLRLYCEVYANLGNEEEAERHLERALKCCEASKDELVRNMSYDVRRGILDFKWRNRVESARELVGATNRAAFRGKKYEALLFLAQAYFEKGEVSQAMETLQEMSEMDQSKIVSEDLIRFRELCVFGYKARERRKILGEAERRRDRARIYSCRDALGDLYGDAGLHAYALVNYKQALEFSDTEDERRSALESCALTALDLNQNESATAFFKSLEQVEKKMNRDTTETQIYLFKMKSLMGMEEADVHMKVDEFEKMNAPFLDRAYESASEYFAKKGKTDEAQRYRKLEADFLDKKPQMKQEKKEPRDELEELSEDEVYEIVQGEFKKKTKLMGHARSKTKSNNYGESRLMDEVKAGNLESVKELIEEGKHEVNFRDYAGWTPLSEAVSAGDLPIVKYLLTKGADPTAASDLDKGGFVGTSHKGKITPLMEAACEGLWEIADWLLNDSRALKMAIAVNGDGWSARDFIRDFMRREMEKCARGEVSVRELEETLKNCGAVSEKIRRLQYKAGFPIRDKTPPPINYTDDTPKFAAEKEAAKRKAERSRRREGRGGGEVYQEAISSLGSRGNKKGKKKSADREDDIFGASDDEPIMSQSSAKKRRAVMSSDEENEEYRENVEDDRDDLLFGLDNEERRPSASPLMKREERKRESEGSQRLSGVQKLLQKRKRPSNFDGTNGIEIVPDEMEIEVREEPQYLSPINRYSASTNNRSPLIGNQVAGAGFQSPLTKGPTIRGEDVERSWSETTFPSPTPRPFSRTNSVTSVTSNSAMMVRVIVKREGEEPKSVVGKVSSFANVADLPSIMSNLRESVRGEEKVEWRVGSDVLQSETTSIEDVQWLTDKRPIEIECRVKATGPPKKTLRSEFERMCDPVDRDSALSRALMEFEKSPAKLSIDAGAKYSQCTHDALWTVLEEYCEEKEKEGKKWRVESVRIEQWEVPSSALRMVVRIPTESLSLRYCGIDDEKMREMEEALSSGAPTVRTLDLSYNDMISDGERMGRMVERMAGVTTLILQGLSGIEEGGELMKKIGGLRNIRSLTLDENPWLDDGVMGEYVRGGGEGKLETIKMSKVGVRAMKWLGEGEALKNLRSLSLVDNSISAEGWKRVGEFCQSSFKLRILDLSGTSVKPAILESAIARGENAPTLTITLVRCAWITSSEIYKTLDPVVAESNNLKLQLEGTKLEDVSKLSPLVAEKMLKEFTMRVL